MAKTKISEFSTTAGNNTDINSINIAENCAPSGINDAIRELMRQLKEFQTGGAGDSVNSGGDFSVATNKFTVASATGNTSVAGTLGATGDFAVNTDKFTVTASSGNTAVAGTLAVTGATTLTGALVANGNSTLGDADTDTVTLNASFVNGTTLKTAKTATNTLALAAYDVDGTAYTNLVTLTAGNTPSLALTSTAVGTINNMSIGATTASTGAFTTLSASGNVTLSGGTANGVLYLNGSKVATAGTALTFDGTNLSNAGRYIVTANSAGTTDVSYGRLSGGAWINTPTGAPGYLAMGGTAAFYWDSNNLISYIGGSEAMRLTSTGLGIGTSSPGTKLDVRGTIQSVAASVGLSAINSSTFYYMNVSSTGLDTYTDANASAPMLFKTGGTERMRLDSSGNLGLGLTPSAGVKLQIGSGEVMGFMGPGGAWSTNAYYQSGFKYATTAAAAKYDQANGAHLWFTAPSGTAGAAITFTQALTLDANGKLLVGLTSSSSTSSKLQVDSPANFKGYTVATLPTGTVGDRAYVTDAVTAVFQAVPTGGGSVKTPVFYNGSNWVCG